MATINLYSSLRLSAMMAALGLVGESIGLGSQSMRKTVTEGEQHALQLAVRTGSHRGVRAGAGRSGQPGDKLRKKAAKGALGSSGRSSRSRIAVPGTYDAPVYGKHGGYINIWHQGKYNPGFLLNCAKANRG